MPALVLNQWGFVPVLTLALLHVTTLAGAEATISISSPLPRQVIQRQNYHASEDYAGRDGGRDAGAARVVIRGEARVAVAAQWEARTTLLEEAFGSSVPWTSLELVFDGSQFTAGLEVPAGGWYRLEVRVSIDGEVVASSFVEPFGAGELFVVAGQSHAANHNESLRQIDDPQRRVVALDWERQAWATANDPQPNSSGTRGSIWPDTMNRLHAILQVPIGFANAAVGATSSREWMPDEKVEKLGRRWTPFDSLVRAGFALGIFRAVLWQQGESDVIEATPGPVYERRMREVVRTAESRWSFSPVWLLAKSTHHPEVYRLPEREATIRAAVARLTGTGPFRPGPDTDRLAGGRYRATESGGLHLTTEGQEAAGLLWSFAIWQEIRQQ